MQHCVSTEENSAFSQGVPSLVRETYISSMLSGNYAFQQNDNK